ncbi:MAG: cellulase family glycosylhydrolase [Fluviicola sp.]
MFKLTMAALLGVAISTSSLAQNLQVVGTQLQDSLGTQVILRGVNYPIIDDYAIQMSNYAAVEAKIDQVALSGANCIRFPWYTDGTHYKDQMNPLTDPGYGPGTLDSYVTNGHLSHMLQYTYSKGMIPILEIHNLTGGNDHAEFQSVVMNFWTDPSVLQLIDENKDYLIINLANEYGLVNFSGSPAVNLTAFKNNYISSIAAMRNAGVHIPIMIDAPDYGQSSTPLTTIASEIITSDVDANVLFSVHAYWFAYANTQVSIQTKMNEMTATNCAFVLGEIANSQADAPTYCGELDLSTLYPIVLEEACSRNLGWLAWSWDQDCDPDREMTSNGNVSNATTYGLDIINNTSYGLKSTSGCGAELVYSSASLNEESTEKDFNVFPNPMKNSFRIQMECEKAEVKIYSLLGELQSESTISKNDEMNVSNLLKGSYIVVIEAENKKQIKRIVIQ